MADGVRTRAQEDILANAELVEVCLPGSLGTSHGVISLLDTMPRLVQHGHTLDHAVVEAARVSVGSGVRNPEEDRALVRYLMRHAHTSPFEMVEAKFHMTMPIFVARQFIRHRTANVNEYSARYKPLPDRFYIPPDGDVRAQSAANKQGRGKELPPEVVRSLIDWLESTSEVSSCAYRSFLDSGVSREIARIGLPLNVFTEWYWKCDLHNILHFLRLRMDPHAQHEIRLYANAMYRLLRPLAPWSFEAFDDYRRNSLTLSALEIAAIREGRDKLQSGNDREDAEFAAKREALGIR